MRLNIHDFSGHPFQAQLSRELAERGHEVLHEYSSQYITGRGNLEVGAGDAAGLRMEAVAADRPMRKYDPLGRVRFEMSYARAWQKRLDARPEHDVVVACNVPLFALSSMRRYFVERQQPWVFWHQDVYSLGIASEAQRRLPRAVSARVCDTVRQLEAAQVRDANGVVAISENFLTQYEAWGVRTDHVRVIPNWAPLDDLVPGERDNAWSRRVGLPTEPVRLLYAGTLGRKHNPKLLLEVLDGVRARGVDAVLVVCSEGVGADDLALAAGDRTDVRILGYQPAHEFSDVLASADIVVALLEPDAAAFSVPSKVLSYLSAGRPAVVLLPEGNPAAHDVRAAGGFVADPTRAGAQRAATWLADTCSDPRTLGRLGRSARALAESRFDIGRIGDEFERVLANASLARRPVSRRALRRPAIFVPSERAS